MRPRSVLRRAVPFVALVVWASSLVVAPPAPAASRRLDRPRDTVPAAKAFVTFDVATGNVIAASNDRRNLRVASTFKIVTALVARANVPIGADLPVSARAEAVPPLKLSMKVGSTWGADGLLHAMLIASLNDAAVALAERAGGGSLAGFDRAVAAEGRRLGFADHPVMHDPAGLDDDTSFMGGNLISARDLAIATRAFLSDPLLATIVQLPSYSFEGGDGKPHIVYNHNAFLQVYPDAIGVKTGYTERSGHSLVAAARRGGRTYAVVVIGSDDPVGVARAQLDRAFAAGSGTRSAVDRLPPIGVAQTLVDEGRTTAAATVPFHLTVPITSSSPLLPLLVVIVAIGAVLAAGTVLRRERRTRSTRPDDRLGATR